MARILIVDDDWIIAQVLVEQLKDLNYEVVGVATTGEEGIKMAIEQAPDLILMDIRLPGDMDGITAAEKIQAEADIAVVFVTGFGGEELIQRAKHLEPFAYLMKPHNPTEIRASIEIALYKKDIERKLRQAKNELEQTVLERTAELTRSNEQLKALMNATSDTSLLIDLEGNVIAANAIAAERLGVHVEELPGSRIWDLMPPALAESRRIKVDRVVNTGKPQRFKDKRDRIIFENTISPVFNSEGEVVQLAIHGKDITRQVNAYENLEESKRELESKTTLLEEANIALKMMLQKSTESKKEIEEEILMLLKKRIVPYISKLKQYDCDAKMRDCIDILESNLRDIVSPFYRRLSFEYIDLTPKEIQVVNFIRQGKSTRQIAELMQVSKGTVEVHRNNIREKLDIKNKKVNLKTYLVSLR